MPRMTIRYRRDGDGHWYELRDRARRLVKTAWLAGEKQYAQREARQVRANLQRKGAA